MKKNSMQTVFVAAGIVIVMAGAAIAAIYAGNGGSKPNKTVDMFLIDGGLVSGEVVINAINRSVGTGVKVYVQTRAAPEPLLYEEPYDEGAVFDMDYIVPMGLFLVDKIADGYVLYQQ